MNNETIKTTQRVALFIAPDEARAIKARAAMEGKTVSRLVVECVLAPTAKKPARKENAR